MSNARSKMWWASAVMLVVFISWAGFQYNDPDSGVWIALYLVAALVSALFLAGRLPWWLPALLTVLCLAWALLILPLALERDIGRMLEEVEGEPWRELAGLLIVAAWSGLLTWRTRRRARAAVRS